MENLTKFLNRLEKIGVKLELISNFPWVYINKINDIIVLDKYKSDHGFVIGYQPIKKGNHFQFEDISKIFKLLRKYYFQTAEEYLENEFSEMPYLYDDIISIMKGYANYCLINLKEDE